MKYIQTEHSPVTLARLISFLPTYLSHALKNSFSYLPSDIWAQISQVKYVYIHIYICICTMHNNMLYILYMYNLKLLNYEIPFVVL